MNASKHNSRFFFGTLRVLLVLAAVCGAHGVRAMVITFDFTGIEPNQPSRVFEESGVKLTVTALRRQGPDFIAANVTQTLNGLGVRYPGNPIGQLDSHLFNEALVWSIDAPYSLRIDRIDFGAWEDGNDFQLYTDITDTTDLFGPGIIPGPLSSFNPSNPWFPLADNGIDAIAATNFAMKVNPAGGTEDFRVPSITFSAVPEPGPLVLLVTGLLVACVKPRRLGQR